jgi:hypothetical protein
VTTETAQQDDPNAFTTASIKRDVTLEHASRLTVTTALPDNDIDLFVLFDEVVGSSTASSGDESVELIAPADGNYQVWVHGFGEIDAADRRRPEVGGARGRTSRSSDRRRHGAAGGGRAGGSPSPL